MHSNYNNQDKFSCLSDQIYIHNEQQDSLKHIQSLRARLSFAQFKLNNGWENKSIFDVEHVWKNRQKKLINDIPTPRFTQQDIIDKRYIKKRSKSLSIINNRPNHIIKKSKQKSDLTSLVSKAQIISHSSSPSPPPTSSSSQESNNNSNNNNSNNYYYLFHPSDKEEHEFIEINSNYHQNSPVRNRNSLDCLSYAISITEKSQHEEHHNLPTLSEDDDEEDEELDSSTSPDWTRTSQLRLSLSIPNQTSK